MKLSTDRTIYFSEDFKNVTIKTPDGVLSGPLTAFSEAEKQAIYEQLSRETYA